MGRRLAFLLLAAGIASGCNALLGIEAADFEPVAEGGGASGEGGRPGEGGGLEEAGSPDAGGVDASDAGPCVDTTTNPRHCGGCGHDCLGGLCVASTCKPSTVANDVGGPYSIALDPSYVYWANHGSQSIQRAPKGGGPTELVFAKPGTGLADGLAVVDGEVYFGTTDTDGGVLHCPVTGCGANPAVLAPFAPSVLDVADGILSFSAADTTDIYRCTLPCGSGPELVAPAQGFVVGVTATPGQVFWSTIAPSVRTKIDGDPLVTIDSNDFIEQMVVVGDQLVYAQLNDGAKVSLRDGGAKRTLYGSGLRNTDHVAVRDGLVFFNDFGSGLVQGQILACPISGCIDGGVLAANQDDPRGVAVDESSVFWANAGANDAGAIMRLAR